MPIGAVGVFRAEFEFQIRTGNVISENHVTAKKTLLSTDELLTLSTLYTSIPAVSSVFKRFLSALKDDGKLAFFKDNVSFFLGPRLGSDNKAFCPHKTLLAMMTTTT
jgi:hypothetical protein